MFRDLLMSLGLLHIEISKDGKRIEYVKGSIEDIEELIEKSKPMSNMKNIPRKIYLQIGDECDSEDFNELSEVSWCKDKIYDNDIEFTLQNKVSDMTKKEIEKLSKEKYPKGYITSGDEYRREGFIQGYKAALQNKVNDPRLLELIRNVTDILEVMDLKDNNRKALLKIKRGLQSILQENKVSNEVEITSTCKNPNCEYCHGTGEIKVDNPTTMVSSYCECFGNGVMSSVPHREEPYKNDKVSDISAEGILDKYYKPKMHWKVVNRKNVLAAMHEYASIVNEKDNIPADFKRVTGHDSSKEMMAYEKGREDEQEVIMKWIEQWDGSSNSAMGTLLKKKFDERKDNVGVWVNVGDRLPDAKINGDKILLFRDTNESQKGLSISVFNTIFVKYCETSSYWMPLPAPPESQPQQKEVDEDEMPPL